MFSCELETYSSLACAIILPTFRTFSSAKVCVCEIFVGHSLLKVGKFNLIIIYKPSAEKFVRMGTKVVCESNDSSEESLISQVFEIFRKVDVLRGRRIIIEDRRRTFQPE